MSSDTRTKNLAKDADNAVFLVRTGLVLIAVPILVFIFILHASNFSSAIVVGLLLIVVPIIPLSYGFWALFKIRESTGVRFGIFERHIHQKYDAGEDLTKIKVPSSSSQTKANHTLSVDEQKQWAEIMKDF